MYGSLISSRLIAVNYDDDMSFRLDMDVDGTENRFVEDRYKVEINPDKTRKSLWRARSEVVPVEGPIHIPLNAAQFRVESSTRTNKLGYPTSYQLTAEHTATSILSKEDAIQKRAAFTDYTLWASAYSPDEKYSSGTYPNQNPQVEGLPHGLLQGVRSKIVILLSGIRSASGTFHGPRIGQQCPRYGMVSGCGRSISSTVTLGSMFRLRMCERRSNEHGSHNVRPGSGSVLPASR